MTQQSVAQSQASTARSTSWLVWLVRLIWLALLVFLVQNAIGSSTELEPRAALIFWVSAGIVLLAGIVIGVVRGKQ